MEKIIPVAETPNYIVLEKYKATRKKNRSYQSEAALEREFIEDLCRQGYEYAQHIKTPEALLLNVRLQLERSTMCSLLMWSGSASVRYT